MERFVAKNPEIDDLPENELRAWSRDFSAALAKTKPPEMQREMEREFLSQRLASDAKVGQAISQIAGKDKTVIFFGANHAADVRKLFGNNEELPMIKNLSGPVLKLALVGSQRSLPEGDYGAFKKVYVGNAARTVSLDHRGGTKKNLFDAYFIARPKKRVFSGTKSVLYPKG